MKDIRWMPVDNLQNRPRRDRNRREGDTLVGHHTDYSTSVLTLRCCTDWVSGN